MASWYRKCALAGVGIWGMVLSSAPARAQGASAAIAEQHFQEGKRLMEAGKTHEACQRFQASQEADPGLGTLLHLASCHEKEGRTATAWAEFNEAAAQAQARGEPDRQKFARDHAQVLEGKLHRIVVDIAERPAGLEIKLDGATFPAGSVGTAVPVDPGDHTIEVHAPAKKAWTQKLSLAPGAGTDRVVVPVLVSDAAVADRRAGAPAAPAAPVTADKGSPAKRWIGVGAGVAGVALLTVGILELVSAQNHKSDSDAFAANGDKPNSDAAYSDATSAQTLGFVLGGAGVVVAGIGGYLFATSFGRSPKATTGSLGVAPFAGAHAGGLSAAGTF